VQFVFLAQAKFLRNKGRVNNLLLSYTFLNKFFLVFQISIFIK